MRWAAMGICLACALHSGPAAAQRSSELAQAEQAYLRVDFDGTYRHAVKALERGGHSRRQLVRIYQLMGISAAALDREEESREAYIHMLALDPAHEVDRNLAPRLRSPFLEARGYWTARSDQLEAEARLDRVGGGLLVTLGDPLNMAQGIVVDARPAGGEWHQARVPASSEQLVPVPGADTSRRVEYAVAVLDAHGNRIVELGSRSSPRVLGEGGLADPTGAEEPAGANVLESPIFWAVLGALVVGATVGVLVLASDTAVGAQTDVTFGVR